MIDDAQLDLTLLLGGVRAGKSAKALSLAASHRSGRRVLFAATAQPLDDEMRRRIDNHRAARSVAWETLESPTELARDITARFAAAAEGFDVVIIDCLTLWVSNLLAVDDGDDAETAVTERVHALLDSCRQLSRAARAQHQMAPRWIVVSNEVGLGVVPPTPLGRTYRDALGRANQLVAAAASNVTLLVAGLEMPLKPR